MKIRKAKSADVKAVHRLINSMAAEHQMLPRSLNDLYENLRDLLVLEDDEGEIKGVCALHVLWEDLAEIRSLAISSESRNKGLGGHLVKCALREAKSLGMRRVFALTYQPLYFVERFKFREVDKSELPQKIWGECLKCHKYPECDETAVIKEIR
ncbi:MAG: N-acetyltransferase [Nitrospirota bacterium]